jgi:hypothetical protein
LGEIGADISYIGKAVDMNNNIQPTQLPRGYGGVAILRKKQDNNIIKQIPDGNERIQCVEFIDNFNKPLFIISAYLPTRGNYEVHVDVFLQVQWSFPYFIFTNNFTNYINFIIHCYCSHNQTLNPFVGKLEFGSEF